MATLKVLHEASAYINRYTYRAINADGIVKIQSKKAWDRRWFTERTMSLAQWDAWEATANLAYDSTAIYSLIDRRSERDIADQEWNNRNG